LIARPAGSEKAWPARRSSEEGIRSVRGAERLSGSPRSLRVARRAIYQWAYTCQ